MNPIERRAHPRIPLRVEVTMTSGSNFYSGRTRDISEGGVFIEMEVDPLPEGAPPPPTPEIGARVDVDLFLGGRTHHIQAEVTWMLGASELSPGGLGMRFTQVAPATRQAIATFMARREPFPFHALPADPPPALRSHAKPHNGPPPLPQA